MIAFAEMDDVHTGAVVKQRMAELDAFVATNTRSPDFHRLNQLSSKPIDEVITDLILTLYLRGHITAHDAVNIVAKEVLS